MKFRRLHYYYHFLHTLFSINSRLLWGMWRLTKLPQPAITVFGGARIAHESIHAEQAFELSKKLVAEGFSIITGGGPGIMEAANFGAVEYLKECRLDMNARCEPIVSAGVGLLHLNRDKSNPYVQDNIVMDYFFTRKWLLVRYAVGFVIFPGGFGTLDEFFEIITLRQTKHMQEAPIILMNSDYWQPMIQWAHEKALKNGLIDEQDIKLFHVLDSVDEAVEILKRDCRRE
jgi:uncharacterized protein (TIGR00730 family)